MLLATLFFTAQNSIIRFVDHMPTMQLVFFRALGTAICCILLLWRGGIPLLGTNRKLLLWRAVVGLVAISLFFRALQIMPLGTAVSLRYLSPFFTAILAVLFLGEKMKKLQWVFIATAFIGVVLLKGFDTRISFSGLVLILAAAFLSGTVYFLIRKIGTSEHPLVVINYFMSLSVLVGGMSCLFFWTQPKGMEWVYLLSLGLVGFGAQYYMTRSLQLHAASTVTPFKYFEVVFTLMAGWMWFGEYQTGWQIMAIGLIVISLIAHVLVRHRSGQRVT